jgi:hypothetical protein
MAGETILVDGRVTSLEFLQAVVRNNDLPLSVRMRAASIAIQYETPKPVQTLAFFDIGDRLDRAIAASGVRMIELNPKDDR